MLHLCSHQNIRCPTRRQDLGLSFPGMGEKETERTGLQAICSSLLPFIVNFLEQGRLQVWLPGPDRETCCVYFLICSSVTSHIRVFLGSRNLGSPLKSALAPVSRGQAWNSGLALIIDEASCPSCKLSGFSFPKRMGTDNQAGFTLHQVCSE